MAFTGFIQSARNSMKFVHAADIHLDSPLRGLERYEGAPIDEIRGATRRAFENLVELCLDESAGLLVIAGDLYDGDWRDYNTGLFFVNQVSRLTQAGVKVVWVRGNHDAASQITKSLRLPQGAFELDARSPQTLVFEDLGVAVHGQSYGKRDVTTDIAAGYPKPHQDLFNIGVLHTALDGREGHDSYAPCSVDRLATHGYDYWALGHVHQREIVRDDPWIVFPGNLQGRHAREAGEKGASLVSIENRAVAAVEARAIDVVRWVDCHVDVTDATSAHDAIDQVRSVLEGEADQIGDRLLAARVRLRGRCSADAELRSDRQRWREEIRAAAMDTGASIWVEKILFETQTALDLDALLRHDDPIANLVRAVRGAASDEEALKEVMGSLEALASKLPSDYRQLPDAINFQDPADVAKLLGGVEQDLLPRLLGIREQT
jgi:exonuclease SbcD